VQETRPVVDLDQLLNDLDAPTRASLQGIIRDGSKLAPAAKDFNDVLAYLNPAVAQVRQTANEIAADSAAVERLIDAGARTAAALAERRDDLRGGIATTARTLDAVAAERASLSDLLGRAPAVLRRSRSTFANLRSTLTEVRPALRELRPVVEPLARVLARLVPASRQAIPAIRQLHSTHRAS
jgi:ABC-type transporter Mla subunit MlaD